MTQNNELENLFHNKEFRKYVLKAFQNNLTADQILENVRSVIGSYAIESVLGYEVNENNRIIRTRKGSL